MISIALSFILIFHEGIAVEPFHHSSTGSYHVRWKEYGACNPPEKRGTNEIFTDMHLSKTRTKMEIVGKSVLKIPFDDSVSANVNFAILGSNSAWLPNAYNLPLPAVCSSMINLLQEGWIGYLRSMNISAKCPIPKGVYETKGYDVSHLMRGSMLPKEFIYGKYKITVEYSKFGKVVGCSYVRIDVIPVWQKKPKQE